MILFPPSKINLGLHVLNKRVDGFHDIETLMFQIPFCDILEIVRSTDFSFNASGIPIIGDENDNLCIKAYNLLKNDFNLPPVKIHLHKLIPMGAGLGGGSSDGTYTLKLLNDLFELNLSADQLRKYALNLGSDCPLFVEEFPQFSTGRGEVLEKMEVNLKGKYIYIVNIGIHVQTKEAFENLSSSRSESVSIKKIVKEDISFWRHNLLNDFEKNVLKKYPQLQSIKDELYAEGAIYSSMTGSGSTIFGIFNAKPSLFFENKFKNVIEKIVLIE